MNDNVMPNNTHITYYLTLVCILLFLTLMWPQISYANEFQCEHVAQSGDHQQAQPYDKVVSKSRDCQCAPIQATFNMRLHCTKGGQSGQIKCDYYEDSKWDWSEGAYQCMLQSILTKNQLTSGLCPKLINIFFLSSKVYIPNIFSYISYLLKSISLPIGTTLEGVIVVWL